MCAAVAPLTYAVNSQQQQQLLPLTVVCDQIRDPCNMAAIITAAATVFASQVLVTKGQSDYLLLSTIATTVLVSASLLISWAESQNTLSRNFFIKNELLMASCRALYALSGKNSLRQNSHL